MKYMSLLPAIGPGFSSTIRGAPVSVSLENNHDDDDDDGEYGDPVPVGASYVSMYAKLPSLILALPTCTFVTEASALTLTPSGYLSILPIIAC